MRPVQTFPLASNLANGPMVHMCWTRAGLCWAGLCCARLCCAGLGCAGLGGKLNWKCWSTFCSQWRRHAGGRALQRCRHRRPSQSVLPAPGCCRVTSRAAVVLHDGGPSAVWWWCEWPVSPGTWCQCGAWTRHQPVPA